VRNASASSSSLFLDPGDDHAPRVQLAVRVQDDGRPEIALQLAAVCEPLQAAFELPVQLTRAV